VRKFSEEEVGPSGCIQALFSAFFGFGRYRWGEVNTNTNITEFKVYTESAQTGSMQ
jgi:hypothetical protein